MATKTPAAQGPAPRPRSARARQAARRRLLTRVGLGTIVAVAVLFVIFTAGDKSGGTGPRFDVGSPGPGEMAPTFALASTTGGTYDLAAARGKDVLLYFQEGIGCQPCWDQIRDIERNMGEFEDLGVDEFVSITVNRLDANRQKAADEGLSTPVLSDPTISLGETYSANQYGMMGGSTYGHSFVLVGPDGRIRWRADYGGAPDYTMYVSVADLLEHMRAGLEAST